ncbi:MAG: HAMP domain-containing protein [Nitrospirae bacterium]|nr:HAMP domain-containing protein [Nitrospirota bacterium]
MKLRKFFDSIAFRISISIAVVVAASTMAVGWLILQEERKTLEAELQSKGRYLAELMSHQVTEPLLYEERHVIFTLLEGSMKSAESLIVSAEVYDKNRELVVSVYKNERYRNMNLPPYDFENSMHGPDIKEDNTVSIYYVSRPVKVETLGTIGFLRLCITKEFLSATLEGMKQKLLLFSAVVTVVGIIFGLYMARKVLQPVLILSKGVSLVGEGEVGVEVPVVGQGEIKDLSMSFNRMSVKLKELIDKMKSAQEHMVKTEKLYAIGEFSAGIAHEIKNPLTPIMMLMRRVKEEKESLTDKDIEIIEEELNRIDKIVTEFLAFARPAKMEKTEVNINEVISEVITLTKPKMDRSGISIIEKYLPELPDITGNNDALKQVFLNIMLNAVQAMDGKGGDLTVETSTGDGNVRVIISDTGTGIPEEHLKKVYDPFFTTKKEGTGMGLALTHNIISGHSGRIDINSAPGKGTMVKVECPSPLEGEGKGEGGRDNG